jgi:hypothetical protein
MDARAEGPSNPPASELIVEALDQARELTRIELALAKDEVRQELHALRASAIAAAIAAALSLSAFASLVVAVTLCVGSAWVALGVGVACAIAGAVVARVARRKVPMEPLGRTMRRLQADVRELKENLA